MTWVGNIELINARVMYTFNASPRKNYIYSTITNQDGPVIFHSFHFFDEIVRYIDHIFHDDTIAILHVPNNMQHICPIRSGKIRISTDQSSTQLLHELEGILKTSWIR